MGYASWFAGDDFDVAAGHEFGVHGLEADAVSIAAGGVASVGDQRIHQFLGNGHPFEPLPFTTNARIERVPEGIVSGSVKCIPDDSGRHFFQLVDQHAGLRIVRMRTDDEQNGAEGYSGNGLSKAFRLLRQDMSSMTGKGNSDQGEPFFRVNVFRMAKVATSSSSMALSKPVSMDFCRPVTFSGRLHCTSSHPWIFHWQSS